MVEAVQDQGARMAGAAGAVERQPEQPQRTWRWATPQEERAVKRAVIDFHAVEPHQQEMDRRLQNWARWCNGGWSNAYPDTCAMFRMAPPPARVRGEVAYGAPSVDKVDAAKVARAVFGLPEKHRKSIHWAYIKPNSPVKKARELGLTMEGLAKHLRDARQMLINTTQSGD